jgi:hypothetical protein
MKFKITSFYFLALLTVLLFPGKTFAGFPIGKYRDIVVPSFSYYHQTDRFGPDDNIIKGMPGTGFTSYSTNIFIGYGISRRLDFIVNLPILYQVNKLAPGNSIINQGAGDLLVGLSYNIINFNYKRFFSIQVSGITPLYANTSANAALGLGTYGSEVKLMYCGNLPEAIFDKGYFNTELAYRRYFDSQGPAQVSLDVTVGYPVTKRNQINVEMLLFRSYSSNKTFNPNVFAERDYAFFKPALNFGHTFTRRISMFVGGYIVPFGINTGVGYGGSVLAVLKL